MRLYLGDCRTMRFLGADVCITDPAYRQHVHYRAVSQSRSRGVRKRDFGFTHLSESLRYWVGEQTRKIAKWSLIYTDMESIGDWMRAINCGGGEYVRAMPWVRWSSPQLSGDRPPSGCEAIALAWGHRPGKKSWGGPGNLTHLDHKCLRGEGKHKAEKPLDQALDLVSWFSEPGDTVVDFFAGSGTIGLACKILDRQFFGAELDPEWHAKAEERIERWPLSERDQERYRRWRESQERRKADMDRMAANTAKARARLEEAS